MKTVQDSEVPDRIWNLYMKKFKGKYLLKKDELGIWHIKCKFGLIQLFSLIKNQLVFVGDFRSKKHLTWFKKKKC
ncbi:hypothetical protein MBGDF03_00978 [Thermoplasmatales archaeon SCGC AB-540-F20]|nr:hypothetical protein MBGDF03_00978 [Thermoplasmatales archaeon SCGC AB-540-F20]